MTGQRDRFSHSARCALAGVCAALLVGTMFSSPALASLVINLRFTDGSTTKDISSMSSGQTVTIEVWMTVSGTNTNHADDGLTSSIFGVTSFNPTANLTGNITSGSLLGPFNDATGSAGTFGDRDPDGAGVLVADGNADWRGTNITGATANTGWPKASVGLFPASVAGGGTVGQAAGATGWEFHVADAVFTIGTLTLPGSGTLNALQWNPQITQPTAQSSKAAWTEDGTGTTGTASNPSAGSFVTFTLTGSVVNNDTVITAPASVDLGGYLLNGLKTATTVNLTKTGNEATTFTAVSNDPTGLTVAADGSIGNGNVNEPIQLALTNAATGSGTYGPKSFQVTVHNSASTSAAGGQGSADPDDIIAVSANIGLATTAGTSLGAPLSANVGPGGSYGGLASKTTAGIESGVRVLGTEAKMLGGSNAGGGQPELVQMAWRARRANERNAQSGGSAGGLPTSPPLPGGVRTLISDVVDLSGLTYQGAGAAPGRTDPYVLQMSYDETLLGSAARELAAAQSGRIYLAWLNPDGAAPGVPQWENAIAHDFTVNGGVQNFAGSWAAAGSPLVVGSWGVDVATNTVWAVIDHTSEFGVVPEPSSIALLGLGAVGLFVGLRRRRRS